jgi:hypothetical protein
VASADPQPASSRRGARSDRSQRGIVSCFPRIATMVIRSIWSACDGGTGQEQQKRIGTCPWMCRPERTPSGGGLELRARACVCLCVQRACPGRAWGWRRCNCWRKEIAGGCCCCCTAVELAGHCMCTVYCMCSPATQTATNIYLLYAQYYILDSSSLVAQLYLC